MKMRTTRSVAPILLSIGMVGPVGAQLPGPTPEPTPTIPPHLQVPRGGGLPPAFFPPGNPFTESKRVLGKILFWDEQLSSDNTRSCGSCHIPAAGGTDPVLMPHPGFDLVYGTPDDKFTSQGIIRSLKSGMYKPDTVFGLDQQATRRAANSAIFSAFSGDLFWDGRARGEFFDPVTGESVLPFAAALESQAVEPILSDVEMAHENRDWNEVAQKLARSIPLALSRDLPPDLASVLDSGVGYEDLFAQAFGDGAITPVRIAFAIATYERTLVPDQTPWDRYNAGETDALTPAQISGLEFFSNSNCGTCHSQPFFLDFSFHNIGVRPNFEDIGREGVTGGSGNRGAFKTPTLRNIGLKASFMHTGGVFTMEEVFAIYAAPFSPGNPNRSGLLPVVFTPFQEAMITDFLMNGLIDPRVAKEEFPFDRPTLFSEWGDQFLQILPGGVPGGSGLTPRMIAATPPNVGHQEFRLGVANAAPGAAASVAISDDPPVAGVVAPDRVEGPFTVAGAGHATFLMPIPARRALDGRVQYMQWRISDPGAPGGIALSPPVRVEFFCNGRCPDDCPSDLAEPFGVLDLADIQAFVTGFIAGDPLTDLAAPFGVFDLADVQAFVTSFGAGCP